MNSKERVLAAFDHREPDRVPRWCGSSPGFWEKSRMALNLDDEGLRVRFGDDFRRISAPFRDLSGMQASPFGIGRAGVGGGMALSHPLEKAALEEILEYPWPDPDRVDVSVLRAEASVYRDGFAILGGDWSPYWHDAIDFAGMENLFVRMYTDPAWAHTLYNQVFQYYLAVNERIFSEAGDLIDVFFIGNDLGSRQGALIGCDLFREYLMPGFSQLADLGHRYGAKVLLHCCGGFRELIPLLIEAGIDGVHAVQPSCHGMELAALKRDFGDRLLFNGCIDSQFVLVEGDPERVRSETRRTVEIMKPGGGFVAGASHDYILEETPLENVLAMFDTIHEFGTY